MENQWRQQQFDYQKQRDAVADSQWQQQFNLSKKASSRSSSSSRSTGSSKKSGGSGKLQVSGDNGNNTQKYTAKEVLANAKVLQRPGNQGAVYDQISGKTFGNMAELLKYYDV